MANVDCFLEEMAGVICVNQIHRMYSILVLKHPLVCVVVAGQRLEANDRAHFQC